jgi:hypothetical protein
MYWRLLAVGEDRALPHRLVPEASDVAQFSGPEPWSGPARG